MAKKARMTKDQVFERNAAELMDKYDGLSVREIVEKYGVVRQQVYQLTSIIHKSSGLTPDGRKGGTVDRAKVEKMIRLVLMKLPWQDAMRASGITKRQAQTVVNRIFAPAPNYRPRMQEMSPAMDKYMAETGLTAKQVAKKLGISFTTFMKYFNKHDYLPVKLALKINRELHIPLIDLYGTDTYEKWVEMDKAEGGQILADVRKTEKLSAETDAYFEKLKNQEETKTEDKNTAR